MRELDELPLAYTFDVKAYEAVKHTPLKRHIDEFGKPYMGLIAIYSQYRKMLTVPSFSSGFGGLTCEVQHRCWRGQRANRLPDTVEILGTLSPDL